MEQNITYSHRNITYNNISHHKYETQLIYFVRLIKWWRKFADQISVGWHGFSLLIWHNKWKELWLIGVLFSFQIPIQVKLEGKWLSIICHLSGPHKKNHSLLNTKLMTFTNLRHTTLTRDKSMHASCGLKLLLKKYML